MNHDRFSHSLRDSSARFNDAIMPCPLAFRAPAPALMAWPVHPATMMAAQGLYQAAYQDAVAATRKSRLERALTPCPN